MSSIHSLPSPPVELAAEPDDPREVVTWPMIRVLFAVANVGGALTAIVWIGCWLNNLAGQPLNLPTGTLLTYTGMASCALLFGLPPVLILFAERYREHGYVPIDEPPQRLDRYRQRSDAALADAEFDRIGKFHVKGLAFKTHCEIFLGCQQMVIAEFVLLGQKLAIELVSITESGRVIVTSSTAPIHNESSEQYSRFIVCTTAAKSSFEKLLQTHLRKTTEIAEVEDSVIAQLEEGDVVDLMNYYNRAYHDMRVQLGKASDPIGPMTYGRFRFPTGPLQETISIIPNRVSEPRAELVKQ